MRKSIAIKMLLRSPVKTLLTLSLTAVASFVLFSRITDYTIMVRETANAESFYHGVAALDITSPMVFYKEDDMSYVFRPDDKPWPADEKLKEFSSLPGVTLADTRYMTAGLVEGYKRLVEDGEKGDFVLEGDYAGYEEIQGSEKYIDLLFNNVTVLAGDVTLDSGESVRIQTRNLNEEQFEEIRDSDFYYGELPLTFFEEVEQGSRCLVTGNYDKVSGRELRMDTMDPDEKAFCVLNSLGTDYLETADFAYQKGLIKTIRQDSYTYDIVYTSDMRAIPRFNERGMVMTEGRSLISGDEDCCVVSTLFLETYHLAVGDKITVELGDKLLPQNSGVGAMALRDGKRFADFVDTKELEIIGAYRFNDDRQTRIAEFEWAYTSSTIFVSSLLLPVAVPDDYTAGTGEYSVFIENACDIETFREAAEPLAAEMGLGLRFSDSGWMRVKDSFTTGKRTSLLSVVLYVLGAVLALFLAVYLYIGGNKRTYAIMRTLGVPARKAEGTIVLTFAVLTAFAVSVSGIAGLLYTAKTATKVFADVSDSMPEGYVPGTGQSATVIALCLVAEIIYILGATFAILGKMRKISPLELLQEKTARTDTIKKRSAAYEEHEPLPAGFAISKLSVADEAAPCRGYNAIRHVTAYTIRHMKRNVGRTLLSLILAVVLSAGTGVFTLVMITYQDAFYKIDVKGRATGFSSASITELSESGLTDDLYYYGNLSVRTDGVGLRSSMTLTNNIEHYLTDNYMITYADGYDNSIFDSDKPVCLLGQTLAETLDLRTGDEITLLTDDLYSFMKQLYDDESTLAQAAVRAGKAYKIAGIIESADENVNIGIFTSANSAAEAFYSQPFPIGFCEFTLTDNDRIDELNVMLDEQKNLNLRYAPTASFYIDTAELENIRRICDLLESLFPIAVAVTLLIGLTGSGLIIVQSATEAAYMRVLGVSKKRARCMLVSGHIVLCIVGMALVAGILYLSTPIQFVRSTRTFAICWTLYLVGCIVGTLTTAIQITRHRILELLQIKE